MQTFDPLRQQRFGWVGKHKEKVPFCLCRTDCTPFSVTLLHRLLQKEIITIVLRQPAAQQLAPQQMVQVQSLNTQPHSSLWLNCYIRNSGEKQQLHNARRRRKKITQDDRRKVSIKIPIDGLSLSLAVRLVYVGPGIIHTAD